MFGLFSKKQARANKTGIYQVVAGKLIELEETPGNGSINSIIESLGFPLNHIYTVHTFDSQKIEVLGFKAISKELVFALTRDKKDDINYRDISKTIKEIDWTFEYSSHNIEDILNDGIDNENISLEFLKSVIDDLDEISLQTYQSEKLGLYFSFMDDTLKAFSSSSWDSTDTKWLKDVNLNLYNVMLEEASLFHETSLDAMEEVNKQSRALMEIPQAMRNEYIHLHKKNNGNINFYNLLMAHYSKKANLSDFLFVNKGRFREMGENMFEVGMFIYEFDNYGESFNVLNK